MATALKKESDVTIKRKKLIKKRATDSSEEKNSKPVTRCYCRKCMTTKSINNFLSATDTFIDKNEFMSVCKSCVSEIYIRLFQSETNMENAMLRLCRMLNWAYLPEAIEATKKHLETQGKTPDDPSVPGIYKMKIVSVSRKSVKK